MRETRMDFLDDGETVLWSGHTAPFALLDRHAGNRKRIAAKWGAEAVLAGALLALYIRNNDPASPVFLALVCGIAVLLILSPLVERRNILGSRYCITDRRAVLIQRNRAVFSMRLEHVDAFQIVTDEAPHPCLVLGSAALDDVDRQLRWRCCHPMDRPAATDDDNAVGMVFYNVENLTGAAALLERSAAA